VLAAGLAALSAVVLLSTVAATAGAAALPGKPAAKSPAKTVTIITTKPLFRWAKASRATRYEVRAYKGSTLLVKKTGLTKLTWTSSKALPKYTALTWEVRAGNAAGSGPWSKKLAFRVIDLTVGGVYQGGKLAYLLQSGDPGYVAGEAHGLIAAVSDQTTAMAWWNGAAVATGATATALGTGRANTATILSVQGTAPVYAAGVAHAYTGGGYADWYLPSKDELNQLFLNRIAIGGFDLTPGGDPSWGAGPYWSSSEFVDTGVPSASFAWTQYFSGGFSAHPAGTQHADYKNGADYRVRAVRSF
jgi:hypothetical protein